MFVLFPSQGFSIRMFAVVFYFVVSGRTLITHDPTIYSLPCSDNYQCIFFPFRSPCAARFNIHGTQRKAAADHNPRKSLWCIISSLLRLRLPSVLLHLPMQSRAAEGVSDPAAPRPQGTARSDFICFTAGCYGRQRYYSVFPCSPFSLKLLDLIFIADDFFGCSSGFLYFNIYSFLFFFSLVLFILLNLTVMLFYFSFTFFFIFCVEATGGDYVFVGLCSVFTFSHLFQFGFTHIFIFFIFTSEMEAEGLLNCKLLDFVFHFPYTVCFSPQPVLYG